jgi:outer membrane protein OmpA-like peptidoglycan-associated protein
MMKRDLTMALAAAALCATAAHQVLAQGVERSEAIASSDALSQISIYSYRDGPKSDLFLRGTPLAATAEGQAVVEYQNDNAQISAEVRDLPAAGSLGPYTTYVLWAVTPDGRATSQGVIGGVEGGKGRLETRYGASQFALIVTAEPHFAVTIPSTMIVLYNVGDDVKGGESKVTTLTERVDYASLAGARLSRVDVDKNNPVEIVQARYALAIARAAGAPRFGADAYQLANTKLTAAEAALAARRGSERKTAPGLAREAVVAGEDARRAALLAATASAAAAERQAAVTAATRAADSAARTAAASTAAETAAATAAAAASAALASEAASQAATDVERQRAEVAARDDLRNRLNEALPTRDSSRGLIAEIGGVQFVTGAAEVNAAARESLARFSGIVASYPGLRFNVEGHTDNVGSAAMNSELSLRRAITVRDYLIAQGVAASSIDVAGLGLAAPIGDNGTADGRTRNRRVEIVVSGGPLGAAN